jgi:hypothetical protein
MPTDAPGGSPGPAWTWGLGENGRCDPSYACLAQDADCSVRTVQRACDAIRDLGLLRWTRRLVRNGPFVEQTSNAFELTPANTAATLPPRSTRIGDRRCASRPGPRACDHGAKAAREWMQDGSCHLTKSGMNDLVYSHPGYAPCVPRTTGECYPRGYEGR